VGERVERIALLNDNRPLIASEDVGLYRFVGDEQDETNGEHQNECSQVRASS